MANFIKHEEKKIKNIFFFSTGTMYVSIVGAQGEEEENNSSENEEGIFNFLVEIKQ